MPLSASEYSAPEGAACYLQEQLLSTQEGGEEAELSHPAGTAVHWILIAMLPLGPAPELCPFIQRSANSPALIGASNTSFDHRVQAAAGGHGVQVNWRQVRQHRGDSPAEIPSSAISAGGA
jgi:hypothetical protein